jgi:hypothetical protein
LACPCTWEREKRRGERKKRNMPIFSSTRSKFQKSPKKLSGPWINSNVKYFKPVMPSRALILLKKN